MKVHYDGLIRFAPDTKKDLLRKYKNDVVQPFTDKGKKNPEFIKRFGEKFYEKKKVDTQAIDQELIEFNERKKRDKYPTRKYL